MAKRKSISNRSRFEIFKRDKFTCQYCGRTPPTVVLNVDHVIPVAAGGTGERHNLVTSCFECNSGKSDKALSDVPRAVDFELAEQVERREQIEAYNKFLIKARKSDDEEIRKLGWHWHNHLTDDKDRWVFGDSRAPSIRGFMKRLPVTEIYDAIDIALSRVRAGFKSDEKAWKYFCGICWKKIRDREGGNG